MKIAFDGQLFLKGNKTGIAWNAHNIILELAKYPENECIIQCFSLHYSKEQLKQLKEYQQLGCKIEYCGWFHDALYKLLWNVLPVPHSLFFKEKADVTQFFNFVVPPGVRGKRVTIIHDMAYKSCPQTVRKKTKRWLEISMKKSCRHADHIITVSEFSKMEIQKYLHVPAERITVVPNAVDHSLYRPDYTDVQIKTILNKYKIESNYFLYLGTIEPRKNLEKLIVSYVRLCKKRENVPQLVLAGGKGWLYDGIYEKVKTLHMQDRILFTGYVEKEEAPILMCGAQAFLFPSLYEGFGMPPLEAMACGTPVITSNTTSLPEVVGEAGIVVNPDSEDEIENAMMRILEDDALREELSKKGLERAQKYTWKNSAKIFMDVYKKL